MKPSDVRTAAHARKIVDERGLSHVKVGVFDIDGMLRGKYLRRDKVLLGARERLRLLRRRARLGFERPALRQCQLHRLAHRLSRCAGARRAVDLPRRCRSRATCCSSSANSPARPRRSARAACCDACSPAPPRWASRRPRPVEYEFFMFEETPHSVREKNYRDLEAMTPGYFGYSVLRSSVHAEFYHETCLTLCERDGHADRRAAHRNRTGRARGRASEYDEALEAADNAALFKTFTKVLAQRRGWMATFMAKWSRDWPGQSGHLHLSLKDKRGTPVFHDAKKPHRMSDTMRWFIGGQQALMPELLAMVASHGELLLAADPRLLGADRRHLGRREPHLRAARHSRRAEVAARRVPDRGGRYQSLPRARGGDRSGLWGIEHKHRAGRRPSRATHTRRASAGASACRARCGTPRSG